MKKFISSMAAALTASTMLGAVNLFTEAANETPKIYVDLVYETETQIRADVMFENMPDTNSGSFYLNISDGWIVDALDNSMNISTDNPNTQYLGIRGTLFPNDNTKALIYYASGATHNYNPNGCFCSFRVRKSTSYSDANSNISAYFTTTNNLSNYIGSLPDNGGNYIRHFEPDSNEPIRLPIIKRIAEYRIGDTDANGYVNASDATDVQVALRKNGGAPIKVSQIENNFKTFFPHATAPAAGDANCDGIISMDDVYYILENYGSSSTGGGYIGNVGSKAIYEYYNG